MQTKRFLQLNYLSQLKQCDTLISITLTLINKLRALKIFQVLNTEASNRQYSLAIVCRLTTYISKII